MATIGGKLRNDSGTTVFDGSLVTDQPLNADTIGGVAINNTPSGAGEVLTTSDGSNAAWAAGGGAAAYVSVWARVVSIDVHDIATHRLNWDVLYDNPWDFNTLTSLPAGLGLSFAIDGSDSEITTTDAGTWAFSLNCGFNADATWAGHLWLDENCAACDAGWPGGAGIGQRLTVSEVMTYPTGAVITPSLITIAEATADPLDATATLMIVRLA